MSQQCLTFERNIFVVKCKGNESKIWLNSLECKVLLFNLFLVANITALQLIVFKVLSNSSKAVVILVIYKPHLISFVTAACSTLRVVPNCPVKTTNFEDSRFVVVTYAKAPMEAITSDSKCVYPISCCSNTCGCSS